MKKDDRFIKTYTQGSMAVMQIWVDRETGVNYLFHNDGYAGGFTILLSKDGKPVITQVEPTE